MSPVGVCRFVSIPLDLSSTPFRRRQNNGLTESNWILEAKEAYIYVRETRGSWKGLQIISTYCFSAEPDGQLLLLTENNLKEAYPQNQTFRDSLDLSSAAQQKLEQYDKVHEMFEVNYLLKASHAQEH